MLAAVNTGNPVDEFLSIGLADALTMRLSNIRRFLVRPTSSVLSFDQAETDPFAAGVNLDVDFIVDGNIRRIGNLLKEKAENIYIPPYFLAMTHLAVGEADTAFEFFEKALTEHSPWIMWFGTEPKLDVIRADPRYLKLLKTTGYPVI